MDPETLVRIEALFHAARERPGSSQDRFVRQTAGADHDLAARVLRMLQFDRADGGLTGALCEQNENRSDAGSTPANASVGLRIGPYHLCELLGEGGFGAVYRARREEPVRQEVAIKVLRIGLESPAAIARFEAERQALAIMEHPNIARVFDAGRTDTALGSRPYLVMELVRGEPLTAHCDDQCLTLPQRLVLFRSVCRAVQHAHQNGVIHRDIKPSNILVGVVDGQAVPKVIDFGIAKALEGSLTGHALVTEARQMLGTPPYMSPEQADLGERSVDTRSDIYALGVVLYELLTGGTPLDSARLEHTPLGDLQRLICDTAVEKPSTRVKRLGERADAASWVGAMERSSLRRRLRGELDWIVMKALEKDRDRRYQSAAEFADDVDRYLSGRAVLAGPPSKAYVLRTFVRRHRLGLAASLALATALFVAVAGLFVGTLRARDEADRASAVNAFMRDLLTSVDPDREGADVRLVDVLDDASSTVADRFAGHPIQEAMVRDLLGAVYGNLGFVGPALEQSQLAVDILREELGPEAEATLRARLHLVGAHINAANNSEAEAMATDLLPRLERAFGPGHPDTLDCRRQLVLIHRIFGRIDEAESLARDTLARARAVRRPDGRLIMKLESALLRTLLLKTQRSGDHPGGRRQAQALLDEATELADRVVSSAASQGVAVRETEAARVWLGEVLYLRDEFHEAADVCRAFLDDTDGRLEHCHNLRGNARSTLAKSLVRLGKYREAADWYIEHIECMRQNWPDDHPALLAAISGALPILDFGGRWSEGEAYAREISSLGSDDSADARGVFYEMYVARFLSKQGRLDEADAIFNKLLAHVQDIEAPPTRARLLLFHGGHPALRGQYEGAEAQILGAVEIMGAPELGTWQAHPDDILMELIALYEAWGKPDVADRYRALLSTRSGSPEEADLRLEDGDD